MINFRVIPSMLLIEDSVVKGKNFQNHTYVGDPINILKIYNDDYPRFPGALAYPWNQALFGVLWESGKYHFSLAGHSCV